MRFQDFVPSREVLHEFTLLKLKEAQAKLFSLLWPKVVLPQIARSLARKFNRANSTIVPAPLPPRRGGGARFEPHVWST
jgi:hypothetical protein